MVNAVTNEPHQSPINDDMIQKDYLSNMTLIGSNVQKNRKKLAIFS